MKARFLWAVGLLGLAWPVFDGAGADPKKPEAETDRVLRLFTEEFVALTPGTGVFPASFTMGSAGAAPDTEKPARLVKLRQPFALARYEVTQELYQAIAGKNPSRWQGPRNSVEMVSWDEAVAFCRKVTTELRQRKLIKENEVIRLPSEAEWEYACRAGTTTQYSFGDQVDDLTHYAWFTGNAKGNDPPVGKKKPNAWGLYDMHGYVWEWCQDSWHAGYQGAPEDARAWEDKDGKERVLRGGSWADRADRCRSAFRHHLAPEQRSEAIGFRCVKAAEVKPDK
jgi:formylglycine-generating enzyme required for sulfatase activity